ncbi:MAG: polysaccharide biosynthesis/export family protein [Bacteroidota bacterium]|nr:polysaccharide biosynthesis/export family protein [Bacteroidota bacterium]
MKKILVILSVFVLSSCVPLKELVYLQDKEDSGYQMVQKEAFKPYRIQLGDRLSLKVKTDLKDDTLAPLINSSSQQGNTVSEPILYFDSYLVDDLGFITIPLLDRVEVLGLTTDEIAEKIEKLLVEEHYTQRTNLFVSVKLTGFKFTVNGEVTKTGSNILYQERVTILEAIAAAGDITVTGNRKEVHVIRRQPHGSVMYTLDLTDKNILNHPDFYIQPNDYIYVKPLVQKTWGTGTTGAQTLTTIVAGLSLVMTSILLLRTL